MTSTPAGSDPGFHGEAVVLRRDLDAAGLEVLHRVVAAAVAELQLERAPAEREREHLVAEADAEERQPARRRSARTFAHDVRQRGRIAGTVAEEDAVGTVRQHLARRRGRREHPQRRSRGAARRRRMFHFIPKSYAATSGRRARRARRRGRPAAGTRGRSRRRRHPEPARRRRRRSRTASRRSRRAPGRRPSIGGVSPRARRRAPRRATSPVRDGAAHHAARSQPPRERPRVDARDAPRCRARAR